MTKQEQLRYEYFIETGIVWIDTNDNIEMDYLKWVENKALTIPVVSNCTTCNDEINYKGVCEMCYTELKLNDLDNELTIPVVVQQSGLLFCDCYIKYPRGKGNCYKCGLSERP